jgi:Protein of unknown function (DUF1064)
VTVRFGRYLRHKFNAVPKVADGIRFASTKEADYYGRLKMRMRPGGDVLFFLRQVPVHLPGGIRYVVDFLEFHNDGSVHFSDVKGFKTRQYLTKKKQVEAIYPIKIEEV